MKTLLGNLLGFGSLGAFVGNLVLLLIGTLIITGGKIGIQTTAESEWRVVAGFSTVPVWIGWVIFWFAFDGFLGGKLSTFMFSKTIIPFVRAVLVNIFGEERVNAWSGRFDKSDTEDKE